MLMMGNCRIVLGLDLVWVNVFVLKPKCIQCLGDHKTGENPIKPNKIIWV